jgi:hypothetical protein
MIKKRYKKSDNVKTEKKGREDPLPTPRGRSRPAFIHPFLPVKEKEEEEEEEEGNPSSRERKRKSGAERRGERSRLVSSGKKAGNARSLPFHIPL